MRERQEEVIVQCLCLTGLRFNGQIKTLNIGDST